MSCNQCKLPLERFQTFKELNGVVMCEMCVAKLVAYDNGERAAEARIVAWLTSRIESLCFTREKTTAKWREYWDTRVNEAIIVRDAVERGEHR